MITKKPEHERRKHQRHIFNYKVELMTANGKNHIHCASFDLSEGGIRVVTNIKLKDPEYLVIINGHKLPVKLVYEESRPSAMMINQTAYYTGFRFARPISQVDKEKLLRASEKSHF